MEKGVDDMKVKFLTAGLVSIIAILSLVFSACAVTKPGQLETAKKVAIKHLNKKYNRKFAVSKARYISQTGNYQLEAYPIDTPDFKFDVFMGSVAGGGISDTYRHISLNQDAIKLVKDYINKISKNNYYFAGSTV